MNTRTRRFLHPRLESIESRVLPSMPSVEVFTDRSSFTTRTGGSPRVVDFDDVTTQTGSSPTAIAADRYRSVGVLIHGEGGQYVGRDFGFPNDYIAPSAPNTYAPGPTAPVDASADAGGNTTEVTFVTGTAARAVTAFGLDFIDTDYPSLGRSVLEAYDAQGRLLLSRSAPTTGNGGSAFLGIVASDAAGRSIPSIARVRLVNGSGWAGVYAAEGVTLDNLTFTAPEPYREPPVIDFHVSLQVSSSPVELMDTVSFRVVTTPRVAVQSQRIEVRRVDESTWTTVASRDQARVVQRLAGRFVARAVVVKDGITTTSGEVPFEVRFPAYSDIVANARIRSLMDDYWRLTLNLARRYRGPLTFGLYPNSLRSEHGFWIVLDTSNGIYSTTMQFGGLANAVGATTGGDSWISARPADRLASDKRSAKYVVGLFHTHTPYTYVVPPLNFRRVGPSDVDRDVIPAKQNDVAGIVYDYVGRLGIIERGHSLTDRARLYMVEGAERRGSP